MINSFNEDIQDIVTFDRMVVYLWSEVSAPTECKFGDTFVKAGQSAYKEVVNRVRESLGVRKDLFDDGDKIELYHYWDVTEYIKRECKDRFKIHGKADDFIRAKLRGNTRKQSTGDVHKISAMEMFELVNEVLSKSDAPLTNLNYSVNQYVVLNEILVAINDGKRRICTDLCTRFGKTTWSLGISVETKYPITIVASYVLTSFTSFKNEVATFEQFRNFVLVNSKDEDYNDQIDNALKNNNKVIVFVSMCNGSNRESRLKDLFTLNYDRLVIIDEADYGVHRLNQSDLLRKYVQDNDIVILMTGTNSDRAVTGWDIDYFTSTTYPELIIEKRLKTNLDVSNYVIENFNVDYNRSNKYVDVEYYQMDMMGVVEHARKSEPSLFVDDGIFLPSWTKAVAHPLKSKGYWITMFQGMFEGKFGLDSVNVDFQTNTVSKNKVMMMFVPANTKVENLMTICDIAKSCLNNWTIVPLTSGNNVKNENAENHCNQAIYDSNKQNKNVLIVSSCIGQRSFSVKEITNVFLAYDCGEAGSTAQKIGRALTSNNGDKVARIFSLSFDPNRDDKFDSMILETSMNYKKRHNVSLQEAATVVLKTCDIFTCQPDGSVKMLKDDYLQKIIVSGSLGRIVGKTTNFDVLTVDDINELANGNQAYARLEKRDAAERGKTSLNKIGKSSGVKNKFEEKKIALAREMVTTIVENFNRIWYYCDKPTSIDKCFEFMENEGSSIKNEISTEFNVSYNTIKRLFDTGAIEKDVIELHFFEKN